MSSPARREAPQTLPMSMILVRDSRAFEVQEWCSWDTEPALAICICQESGGFTCLVKDPEHGCAVVTNGDSLEHVLSGLPTTIIARYNQLFALAAVTPEALHTIGFGWDYEIVSVG